MKGSEDLAAVLQVGTRRTALPPLDLLPELEGCSTEKRALVWSGVLDLMTCAGALPSTGVQAIAPPPEEEARIADRAAEPLREAISAGMVTSVLEWAGPGKAGR